MVRGIYTVEKITFYAKNAICIIYKPVVILGRSDGAGMELACLGNSRVSSLYIVRSFLVIYWVIVAVKVGVSVFCVYIIYCSLCLLVLFIYLVFKIDIKFSGEDVSVGKNGDMYRDVRQILYTLQGFV